MTGLWRINMFGLQTFAKCFIRKSRYWTRVDGSTWWRNPDTDSIEPYSKDTSYAEQVSPQSYISGYTEGEKEHVLNTLAPELKEKIDNFQQLDPDEQDRILDIVENPAMAYLTSSINFGPTLGVDQQTDPDKYKPLFTKLLGELLSVNTHSSKQNTVDELISILDRNISVLYSIALMALDEDAADAIYDSADSMIPFLKKAVLTPSKNEIVLDSEAIIEGLKEFEAKFLDIIQDFMNR